MPHLMNCGHSDEGHCLDCVKRDWEAADAELTRIRAVLAEARRRCGVAGEALRFELGSLIKYSDGSTHYEGCDKNHRACAAIKRLRAALAELEKP